AERRVQLGAGRVEDPHDRALDAEALLGDLADDDVRVVAVRGHDDGVRLFDTRLSEDVHVHAVTDDEPAGPLVAETRKRFLVLIDRNDVPTDFVELLRHGGPHSTAPYDYRFHIRKQVSSHDAFFLQNALRIGDHHHLARGLAEHEVDRRAEEAGL